MGIDAISDAIRESPKTKKVCANVGVIRTEGLRLTGDQRAGVVAVSFPEIVVRGATGGEDHFADVMQKAEEERIFALFGIETFERGQAFSAKCGLQAVVPDRLVQVGGRNLIAELIPLNSFRAFS